MMYTSCFIYILNKGTKHIPGSRESGHGGTRPVKSYTERLQEMRATRPATQPIRSRTARPYTGIDSLLTITLPKILTFFSIKVERSKSQANFVSFSTIFVFHVIFHQKQTFLL